MRAAAVAENENRDVENRVETDAAIWLVNRFWSDRFMHIAHVIATIVGVVCARARASASTIKTCASMKLLNRVIFRWIPFCQLRKRQAKLQFALVTCWILMRIPWNSSSFSFNQPTLSIPSEFAYAAFHCESNSFFLAYQKLQ